MRGNVCPVSAFASYRMVRASALLKLSGSRVAPGGLLSSAGAHSGDWSRKSFVAFGFFPRLASFECASTERARTNWTNADTRKPMERKKVSDTNAMESRERERERGKESWIDRERQRDWQKDSSEDTTEEGQRHVPLTHEREYTIVYVRPF